MSATITYPDTSNMFADSKKITLDKINQGGGGGGGSSSAAVTAAILAAKQVYRDHTPTAPNTPTLPAINYDSATGTIQQWDTVSQTWV